MRRKMFTLVLTAMMTAALCACSITTPSTPSPEKNTEISTQISTEEDETLSTEPGSETPVEVLTEKEETEADTQKKKQTGTQEETKKDEDKQTSSESGTENKTEQKTEGTEVGSAGEESNELSDHAVYPGYSRVEIVNARGDITAIYQLDDGSFMDKQSNVYKFDGNETWYDSSNVEWNQTAEDAERTYPGPDSAVIVNQRGDETTVYKLTDGTFLDRQNYLFTYSEGEKCWYSTYGVQFDEKAQ